MDFLLITIIFLAILGANAEITQILIIQYRIRQMGGGDKT